MSDEWDPEIQREVSRITRLLDQLIRLSGTTKLAVEKKMGWSAGYLSRLSNGSIELRFRHILLVTRALGVNPAAFFQAAYPQGASDEGELAALLDALRGSRPEPPRPGPPVPSMSDDEFESRIASALIRLFGRVAHKPASAPAGSTSGAKDG